MNWFPARNVWKKYAAFLPNTPGCWFRNAPVLPGIWKCRILIPTELLNLDKKYSPPDGRLYAAFVDGVAAGCGGFRKIDRLTCEMKRLFVRQEFRGYGIGRLISERLITEAQTSGYRKMLLDTLPFLKDALFLYKKLGFYEIPRYNENPLVSSIYMQRDL